METLEYTSPVPSKTVVGKTFRGVIFSTSVSGTAESEVLQAGAIINTTFSLCIFSWIDFNNTVFRGCTFEGCVFDNCTFAGVFDSCKVSVDNKFINGYYGRLTLFNTSLDHLSDIPSFGSFVGYKLVVGISPSLYSPTEPQHTTTRKHGRTYLLELLITGERVRPLGGLKCRCSEAIILHNEHLPKDKIYLSGWDMNLLYKPGNTLVVPEYDPTMLTTCTNGIHFFTTPQQALDFLPSFRRNFAVNQGLHLDDKHLPEYAKSLVGSI